MRYAIGEEIHIPIHREEPNFDRACDAAMRLAVGLFGGDDDGHLSYVIDYERSRDSIEVKFVNLIMYGGYGGRSCYYEFVAKVVSGE